MCKEWLYSWLTNALPISYVTDQRHSCSDQDIYHHFESNLAEGAFDETGIFSILQKFYVQPHFQLFEREQNDSSQGYVTVQVAGIQLNCSVE